MPPSGLAQRLERIGGDVDVRFPRAARPARASVISAPAAPSTDAARAVSVPAERVVVPATVRAAAPASAPRILLQAAGLPLRAPALFGALTALMTTSAWLAFQVVASASSVRIESSDRYATATALLVPVAGGVAAAVLLLLPVGALIAAAAAAAMSLPCTPQAALRLAAASYLRLVGVSLPFLLMGLGALLLHALLRLALRPILDWQVEITLALAVASLLGHPLLTWAFGAAAVIVEDRGGTDAVGRANDLLEGRRSRAAVILGVATLLPIGAAALAAQAGAPAAPALGAGLALSALIPCALVALYLDEQRAFDGPLGRPQPARAADETVLGA